VLYISGGSSDIHLTRQPLCPRKRLPVAHRGNSGLSGLRNVRPPMPDPLARTFCMRLPFDPSWDFDHNGLLVQRLPSGEVALHVPPSLPHPCVVIHRIPARAPAPFNLQSQPPHTAPTPSAGDSSIFEEEVVQGTQDSVATPRLAPPQILRILTRGPAPKPGILLPVRIRQKYRQARSAMSPRFRGTKYGQLSLQIRLANKS
jgi:hypothetical protein